MLFFFLFSGIFQKAEFPMSKETLTVSVNKFGIDLIKEVGTGNDNVFISPFSIYTALSMVYEGARGKTAGEMKKVMGITGADLSDALFQLNKDLFSTQENFFEMANSLWLQRDFPVLPTFKEKMKRYYQGNFYECDFRISPEKERIRINKWVSDKTHERIEELFAPGDITNSLKLVLVNAIYFLGKWEVPFDKEETHRGRFNTGNKEIDALMMDNTDLYQYGEFDGFKALRMDYKDGDFSILILLPDEVNGIGAVMNKLNQNLVDSVENSLERERVHVVIPKFTIDKKYLLNPYLISMGIKTAFSSQADFSGITGKKDLFISKVVHRAFVKVDEEGTEAAAATGITMKLTAAPRPVKVFEFIADHPFLFFIIHRNGTVLFAGKLVKPEIKEEE